MSTDSREEIRLFQDVKAHVKLKVEAETARR
jgi:hypothetical protein